MVYVNGGNVLHTSDKGPEWGEYCHEGWIDTGFVGSPGPLGKQTACQMIHLQPGAYLVGPLLLHVGINEENVPGLI